jgi:hypothetical protein
MVTGDVLRQAFRPLKTQPFILASRPMKVTRTVLLGVALTIFTGALWLHWPSVNGGFLTRMDDDEYLRQSVHWQGLSWGAVRWAFTSTEPYWQPLPRLSHVLDYQLWGTNARGHHATSVVIHALNAALVFGFLWTLLAVAAASLTTRERLAWAISVAAVFAIHPLQVESVAWMSRRTQLLCTTFGIGSLWAYVAGARRWMVWALFVAALFCKPLAVSLPFAMLALDYFLARRDEEPGWGRLLRRNAALIVVGVAAAVATIITESRAGRSARAVRGRTTVAACAPDGPEPDVLPVETGLAGTVVALLSAVVGYLAIPTICHRVAARRRGDYGAVSLARATRAGVGGGVGDVCASHSAGLGADADGWAGDGGPVRLSGHAAAAGVGG